MLVHMSTSRAPAQIKEERNRRGLQGVGESQVSGTTLLLQPDSKWARWWHGQTWRCPLDERHELPLQAAPLGSFQIHMAQLVARRRLVKMPLLLVVRKLRWQAA